ncbi:MAG: hypothetical protein ACLSG7_06630 [Clostridia bacterium]
MVLCFVVVTTCIVSPPVKPDLTSTYSSFDKPVSISTSSVFPYFTTNTYFLLPFTCTPLIGTLK